MLSNTSIILSMILLGPVTQLISVTGLNYWCRFSVSLTYRCPLDGLSRCGPVSVRHIGYFIRRYIDLTHRMQIHILSARRRNS